MAYRSLDTAGSRFILLCNCRIQILRNILEHTSIIKRHDDSLPYVLISFDMCGNPNFQQYIRHILFQISGISAAMGKSLFSLRTGWICFNCHHIISPSGFSVSDCHAFLGCRIFRYGIFLFRFCQIILFCAVFLHFLCNLLQTFSKYLVGDWFHHIIACPSLQCS